MPGGDGRDLVERLQRMRPTIKALYISGHIEADVARGTLSSAAFLQKPFGMDMLVDTVRAVLDAAEVRIARCDAAARRPRRRKGGAGVTRWLP